MGVSIKNLTRQHLKVVAGLPFQKVAEGVLPNWDISLVFIGPKKALALNKQLRNKEYIPNVLSFKLGDKSGEIFICPKEAEKQAPSFNLLPSAYTLLLFIHGLLHIKGMAHSAKMEKCEQELLSRYVKTNSNRNRYRHVPDKNGRGGRNRG
jgi:rRNA maturation RNase YbeY